MKAINYLRIILVFLCIFLFALTGWVQADTYESQYGSSQTHNLDTSLDTHKFLVNGIWGIDVWTEWYINGVYKESDHSYWPFYTDPDYSLYIGVGTTVVEAKLWNEGIGYFEFHTWNMTGTKPDLIARNLSVSDSTPDAGDAITVYFNIKNQGDSTAGHSYQGIMLSSSTNITASDQELASEYTGSLDPGEDTDETNYGVDIPTGISGRWYIGIIVDKDDDVDEGDNENNNNTAYVPIDIPAPPDPPDLELQTVDATNGTYHPGDNIDVRYVIRNIGDEVSDSYTVDFYASTNTTISDSDYKIGQVSWTGLAGNTTRDKTLSCQFPPNSYDSSSIPENDYYIGAIVTCSNDSDSSNNKDYDSTRVSIVFSKPDLTPYKPNNWDDKIPIGITRLAGSEDHSFSGPYYNDQILYFNWASLNQGGAPALNYTIRMEVTGSDGTNYVATCDTQPNSYSYGTNDFQVGPLLAGSHTFKLWVDNGNLIDNESDETNNYYEHTIIVQSRDIDDAKIVSFTPPTGLKERGDQVTATVRVKNTSTSTRSFWVGLSFAEEWVDVDETPGPWPEGWYDVRPKETGSLSPEDWKDVQFDFIIPPTSAPGTYTARAAVWDGYDAYIHKMDEPRYAKSDVLSYTLDEYPNPAGPLGACPRIASFQQKN